MDNISGNDSVKFGGEKIWKIKNIMLMWKASKRNKLKMNEMSNWNDSYTIIGKHQGILGLKAKS